jgi:hypothetical protein
MPIPQKIAHDQTTDTNYQLPTPVVDALPNTGPLSTLPGCQSGHRNLRARVEDLPSPQME